VSEGDPGRESFEQKLSALAREVGESLERVAGRLDLGEIADSISAGADRVKEWTGSAGQWLNEQAQDPDARRLASVPQAHADTGDSRPRLAGPHPLDVPTEEQGLALSALDSGRWKVEPGTNELISEGSGPVQGERVGLVGELRARDWITAGGEVTLLGREALLRWKGSNTSS
jgi:hypothetical protein